MGSKSWQDFLTLCQAVNNEKMLKELFNFFLTPEEKNSIEGRCAIVKALIEKEKPQRQIAEELQVSIAKITRGSNELKRISPKLLKFLKQKLLQK